MSDRPDESGLSEARLALSLNLASDSFTQSNITSDFLEFLQLCKRNFEYECFC